MQYKIINREEEGRIEAVADDRVIGLIDYSITSPDVITIFHTEVNEEDEGQGIAASLTKDLLHFIEDTGFKVRPLCAYARAYIERHPEYKRLVY